MSTTQQAYRDLCQEVYIPIHSQAWWLDVVCGPSNWGACIHFGKDDTIKAAMPYYVQDKWFGQLITMPPLTTYCHAYFSFPEHQKIKRVRQYTLEKQYLERLIEQLPKVLFHKQNFTAKLQNCLPFIWQNYKQTTRYTYVLERLDDLEAIYQGFKNTVRTDIKKAEKQLFIETTERVEVLFDLLNASFQRKRQVNPIALPLLTKLYKALKERKQCCLFLAKNHTTQIPQAALLLIWDEKRAAVLLTGLHQSATNNAALQLLYWEAIQYAARLNVEIFDFEGSMDKGIEHLFRSFGGKREPYAQIYKARTKLLELFALALNKF